MHVKLPHNIVIKKVSLLTTYVAILYFSNMVVKCLERKLFYNISDFSLSGKSYSQQLYRHKSS